MTEPTRSESEQLVDTVPVPVRADERGALLEPIEDDKLRSVFNVHLVSCRPGAVRGNHLHPIRTEIVIVIGGTFELVFRDVKTGREQTMTVSDEDSIGFRIPPGIAHAFKSTGSSTGYLLCYADVPFDEGDIEPVRLLS